MKGTRDQLISMQQKLHKHRAVSTRILGQRSGVPYELERRVCKICGRELELRPLRRAAA